MEADERVVEVERVCCLECGTNYVKPTDGTAHCNPGCPRCGYPGWISAFVPLDLPETGATRARPPRSGEDPRPSHAVKRR
jgi:hypothetical protein